MVPTVVEFENEGNREHVTEQARNIARGMGKAPSRARKHVYAPSVIECVRTSEPVDGTPPGNLDLAEEVKKPL
jgi:hypothetical protein